MTTLGEDLPKQMARVRDEVIPAYNAIGIAGNFAVEMMKQDLKKAEEAIAEGDTVQMIRVYESLKGYQL